jgi:hypothetical protein
MMRFLKKPVEGVGSQNDHEGHGWEPETSGDKEDHSHNEVAGYPYNRQNLFRGLLSLPKEQDYTQKRQGRDGPELNKWELKKLHILTKPIVSNIISKFETIQKGKGLFE